MKERILQAYSQPLTSEHADSNSEELNVEETAPLSFISLFIFGCGAVGSELLKQINHQQLKLLGKGIKIAVYGLANSTELSLDVSGAPNLQKAELLIKRNEANNLYELKEFVKNNSIKNSVIVDCTSSRQVALAYIDFLQAGFHVVAANKIANSEPFIFYQNIRKASRRAARKFLYETNIGAGLPIIEPLQKLMTCGDELNKFEGILSGSLSYIFGEISQGVSFSEATLKAKQLGFTEPDPRVDLSGLDVARKVLIIAREIGLSIELSDIEVEGLIPKEIGTAVDIDDFLPG